MLRSRMLTPGFKLYFGIALLGLVGAFLFGVNTELQTEGLTVRDNLDEAGIVSVLSGPFTVGWKGAVGNHMGYTIWLTMAVVAGFLAFLLVAFRDADPEAVAEVAHTEAVPLTRAPSGASYMPVGQGRQAVACKVALSNFGPVGQRSKALTPRRGDS